MILLDIGL